MKTRTTERGAEHTEQKRAVGLRRRWELSPRTSNYESEAHSTELGLPPVVDIIDVYSTLISQLKQ